jgi:general nucleoside transport system permease protein
MLAQILSITFIVSLLTSAIRIATPLLFAALGELVTEKAGIMNLGLEGVILLGALTGFLASFSFDSLWSGILAAAISGLLLGLLFAFLVTILKSNQTITGLALLIFCQGLSFYIYRLAFRNIGTGQVPTIETFDVVQIPLIANIPILGEILFSQRMITYAVLLIVPLISWFLYKTPQGLTLRVIGENPRAVDTKGINIYRYQLLAILFGCMMASIGGAFLTLGSSGMFVPGISSGRGWIAIALVIFGDWKPSKILLGSLIFAFLDSLQLHIQGIGVQFPYQIMLAVPYVMTILALVINQRREGAPINLGITYHRE